MKNKIRIISHRGLDPARSKEGKFWKESSLEAFEYHLDCGFGLEFDVRVTADKDLIVIHDASLDRLTGGKDTRKISEITTKELLSMDFDGSHLTTLPNLLELIGDKATADSISAIHIKHEVQTPESLDLILAALEKGITDYSKFILFDVTLESARYIREKNPRLQLAFSCAHPYDIARYNSAVGGTLYSVEQVLTNRKLCDWVWLDEWDLTADKNGGTKSLYNSEVFAKMRAVGLKIALITPELHATSPGLLGGEAHQDAKDQATLKAIFRQIISLDPDAICTDWPHEVQAIYGSFF